MKFFVAALFPTPSLAQSRRLTALAHSLVVMNIITMTFVAPNLAWGKARGGSISQSGSVTDEQRRQRPNSAQPFGRQFFFGQTSLLAPHRPLKGMLVARASSGRKIPRRERHRSYAHDHLAGTMQLKLGSAVVSTALVGVPLTSRLHSPWRTKR